MKAILIFIILALEAKTDKNDIDHTNATALQMFAAGVRSSIRSTLDMSTDNELSRRPGFRTPAAIRRRDQFYGWFNQLIDKLIRDQQRGYHLGRQSCVSDISPLDVSGVDNQECAYIFSTLKEALPAVHGLHFCKLLGYSPPKLVFFSIK